MSDLFRERDQAERFDGAESNETTLLCYSSGTTGLPKGVETTHHNLTSELQALNSGSRQLVSGQDAVLGVLPFSHVYGFGMVFLQPLVRGVPVVVLPRFQEIPALEAIQKVSSQADWSDQQYKVTHALIVPPILIILVNSVNVRRYDLSSLRTVVSGAAPLGAELAEEFAKLIPGVIMMQAYGNTETSPVVSCAHAEEFAGRPGSVGTVGKLLPTYQARLVGDDGNDVGNGERGELWVRGPTVMKGYLGNPEATKKAIAPGGWYRTGDVCVRDSDGWYTIVDRVKELIKYKGFQGESCLLSRADDQSHQRSWRHYFCNIQISSMLAWSGSTTGRRPLSCRERMSSRAIRGKSGPKRQRQRCRATSRHGWQPASRDISALSAVSFSSTPFQSLHQARSSVRSYGRAPR